MDNMLVLLSSFAALSQEEMAFIRSLARPVQFEPQQSFRLSDWVTDQGVAFLNKGVLFSAQQKPNQQDLYPISILIDDGHFLSDKYKPSGEILQSLTKTEIIVLDSAQCGILSFLIPQWEKIMDNVQLTVLIDRLERLNNQTGGSARLRYLQLIEHYPAITQQVPLQFIASHLGITRQSLSRIRNKLAHLPS